MPENYEPSWEDKPEANSSEPKNTESEKNMTIGLSPEKRAELEEKLPMIRNDIKRVDKLLELLRKNNIHALTDMKLEHPELMDHFYAISRWEKELAERNEEMTDEEILAVKPRRTTRT